MLMLMLMLMAGLVETKKMGRVETLLWNKMFRIKKKKKSKKTESKGKPVEKTETNQGGETLCLVVKIPRK